jgi:NAD dependent epimerase/dehydratase
MGLFERVFITGAAGFIGSHVVEYCLKQGFKVTALVEYSSDSRIDNLKYISSELSENLTIKFGNINEFRSVKNAMEDHDLVLHLAALISIPYSYENPQAYFKTNVLGTFNVMQAALELNVKRVIHTSTSEVYGTPHDVPIKEDFPLQGQSPYSASKIGADKVVESFYHSFNLPVTTVRPFNTYGPRQSIRAIIPSTILQALYTGKIKHGYLEPTRDLTYVEDTARMFLEIAKTTNTYGQVLNVGNGKEIKMRELVQKIKEFMGSEVVLEEDPKRIRPTGSEVMRLCADTTKIRELTGFEPRVTLDEGIKKTIEWFKINKPQYEFNRYYT